MTGHSQLLGVALPLLAKILTLSFDGRKEDFFLLFLLPYLLFVSIKRFISQKSEMKNEVLHLFDQFELATCFPQGIYE